MYIKRSCEGQIFLTNHIHRAKNNNNNRNWFDIQLFIKEMLYHYVAPFKIGSFHETGSGWWVCWLLAQGYQVQIPDKSWSFSEGLALDWKSSLVKNNPWLEWPMGSWKNWINLLTYTYMGDFSQGLSCLWFIIFIYNTRNK
jgi:hypothetical protein